MSKSKKTIKIFGYWAGEHDAGISASEVCITIDLPYPDQFTEADREEAREQVKNLLEVLCGEPPDNGIHFEDECVTCGGIEEHKKGCPDQEPEIREL